MMRAFEKYVRMKDLRLNVSKMNIMCLKKKRSMSRI